jgi:hypothetical protein
MKFLRLLGWQPSHFHFIPSHQAAMSTGWVHHMSKHKMKTDGLLAPGNGGRYVTFAEHREKSGSFLVHFFYRFVTSFFEFVQQ